MIKRLLTTALVVASLFGLAGCKDDSNSNKTNQTQVSNAPVIRLLSGSENKSIEPILQEAARQAGATLQVEYKGSVDIELELQKGKSIDYDAVMPADRMWITLGDQQKVVKNIESIYRSPVVLGVKKSVAERLGWTKGNVTVSDILKASQSGKLRFMMTSATQSNSGAASYFGFLYAFAGSPDVLSDADLAKPEVAAKVKSILKGVNRTAGSSGWLKDLFVLKYDYFDAMFNYESMLIETNQTLAQQGKEPLFAVYPVDGLAIADAPLGYVNKGDATKEAIFLKIQAYMTSADVQKQLIASGRRAGLGINLDPATSPAFNSALGFDVSRVLSPINMPSSEVIQKALTLYQTAFRKPSLTIYVLDFSGSMQGRGVEDLKSGMRVVLDQSLAEKYLLQSSPDDVTIVIPFDASMRGVKTVKGNDPTALNDLWAWINSQDADGGTDFYTPASAALKEIKKYDHEKYSTAIILMTDGQSEGSFEAYKQNAVTAALTGVPVYSIMFGAADPSQLTNMATFSSGKVFDAKKDLIKAFREAKGYN
ncbi:MAG: substrate-binding domain-containing protein [Candidatus Obscuribacterales bacterium]|jgi:Ca-activated chloride channel family protein